MEKIRKEYIKTIYVDFDGTICPNKGKKPSGFIESYPPPSEECLYTLKRLHDKGHKIIIFSVRSNKSETNREFGHTEMLEYLEKWKIPYDGIHLDKSHFSIVIDDKCCGIQKDEGGNVDWIGVLKVLKDKKYI